MKRRISRIVAVLAVAAMTLTAVGCGGGGATESDSGAAGDAPAAAESTGYKIGFSQCTMASPFYVTMVDVAQEYAKEVGVELVYSDANEDVTKQNNDINDMISQGIDALILNPINAESAAPGVEACQEAGIPVITIDRNVNEGNTAYVGRDNEAMGRLVGEALLEALGGADSAKGKILEIQGTAGDTVMMARRDGFESAFEGVDGIEIVQSAYCDYTRSKAVTATQDLLQAHKEGVVAVYGHNDDMSLGAMQVLEEQGVKDVMVTGVDGLMEAVMAIDEGKYAITTMNDPGSLLKVAIDTTLKILNGESYDEFVDAGTGVIDADNAADYVDESLAFAAMK